MNCYQKILQKNVYRTCDRNCKQIASVVSLHRNDKNRTASVKTSCHREHSVAIYWPGDCFTLSEFAMTRFAGKFVRNDKIRGQVCLQWQETCGRFPQKTNRWRFSSQ